MNLNMLTIIVLNIFMLNVFMLNVFMLNVVMLHVVMFMVAMKLDYHYVECRYAECSLCYSRNEAYYAELSFVLIVEIKLNMLIIITLNVSYTKRIVLGAVMISVVILNVAMLIVMAPSTPLTSSFSLKIHLRMKLKRLTLFAAINSGTIPKQ
jgi:hypothetical protein